MSWTLFAFAYFWPITAGQVMDQLRSSLAPCWTGPAMVAAQGCSGRFDVDGDCDVDLRDWAALSLMAAGPRDADVSPASGIPGVTRCTMAECFDDPNAATACWGARGPSGEVASNQR